jgi:hypothetical protein
LTWSIIELPARGVDVSISVVGLGSVVALVAFFALERRRAAPMLDLALFRSRQFSAANAETFVVYAALGGAFFLLPLQLQMRLGYSPLAAGLALLPVTILMLLLSARMGQLAQRIGPRVPMTIGPMICAAGLLLLARLDGGGRQLEKLLPAVVLFGLGLATTVAPLTATVLGAAPSGRAGIASAINNCVARTAGLLAVATLPAVAGLSGHGLNGGFRQGMLITAALCAAGGCIGWLGIRNPARKLAAQGTCCPLDATPLRSEAARTA